MPFTLRNITRDLEDIGSLFNGAPDHEFRAATKALELEQSSLSYQSLPPGYRFPYGHTHVTQEEVYVVLRGSGRMKLDDEIVELEEWDAVRVPPGTWRGYEAGPDGLELLVAGATGGLTSSERHRSHTLPSPGECSSPWASVMSFEPDLKRHAGEREGLRVGRQGAASPPVSLLL